MLRMCGSREGKEETSQQSLIQLALLISPSQFYRTRFSLPFLLTASTARDNDKIYMERNNKKKSRFKLKFKMNSKLINTQFSSFMRAERDGKGEGETEVTY